MSDDIKLPKGNKIALNSIDVVELYTADQLRAAVLFDREGRWLPIETAPQNGRTLLLGYFNSHQNWRTVRGQWMSEDYIAENWEESDDVEPGWFETSVEADETPNCWRIQPSHWMPLPDPPTDAQRAQETKDE